MGLASLRFLYLDGQTTGFSPRNAELIELGWSFSDDAAIETKLLRPSAAESVPAAVWAATGLTAGAVSAGEPAPEVWRSLAAAAKKRRIKAVVIHYAQFERPFLEALNGEPLPWPVLCTYRIARRLHPDLPAKSLRAVSGHFGGDLIELSRAEPHVAATRRIWGKLVETLREREKVTTWKQLEAWLARPEPAAPRKKTPRKYLVDRALRLDLPEGPGVYEMHAANGRILYIGKATSLRDRVNSYFRQRRTTRTRLPELMSQVADVKVTPTETAVEAALLENDRIKQIEPPYNESLRSHARRLLFASPDLLEYADRPDAAHPWGPFLSRSSFDSLERLVLVYRDELPEEDAQLLKHTPEDIKSALEECLGSLGVEDFSSLWPADLLRAARRLPPPAAVPEPEESEEEKPEETPVESIHRKLRRSLRRLHHAHWLCWLTESRVTWSLPDGRYRYLVVRAGGIAERGFAGKRPRPGRFRRDPSPLRARQARMDLATYERMRILATELSILARRGAKVSIELSRRRFIDDKSFARLRGDA